MYIVYVMFEAKHPTLSDRSPKVHFPVLPLQTLHIVLNPTALHACSLRFYFFCPLFSVHLATKGIFL